jgi:tetratricopeptide (TPR) repeat protein
MERLFPQGIEGKPALTSDYDKFLVIIGLANSYLISGQPGRAAELYVRSQQFDDSSDDSSDGLHAATLINLSYALFDIGALRQAEGDAREALVLIRNPLWKSNDHEGYGLESLGRLLGLKGEFTGAYVALCRSRQAHRNADQTEENITALLAELSLWREDLVNANAWAQQAREIAEISRAARGLIFADALQGQIALGTAKFARAGEHLHDALTRARAANVVELEVPTLIAIAQLELQCEHPANARIALNDIWEAAERGPYPLRQADAYNVLASIELAEGNKPAAIDAATRAYKAAWCDGPPYAYHWGLQKAKAHLAALGAPEPDMPPFDESKFEPLPEVEINPKDEHWVDPDKLD